MNDMIRIDAHVHLWEVQHGTVNGQPVTGIGNGLANFGGEIRQMMPPYMTDNRNTAERLLANMDYAGVNACVVTQETIDGNQDDYLVRVRKNHPERFRVCSLYEEGTEPLTEDVDGIKICAGRLSDPDLKKLAPVFLKAEREKLFISVDLADGDAQVEDMEYLISLCPSLRIAVGHFGMVTTKGWQRQIALAKHPNVRIESGGLTWLFHKEFYPYPSAIDAICEARDICGMDKLMWGSDYPRTMTDITYTMALRFIMETNKLTEAEKRAFLGENAAEFYGLQGMLPIRETPNML